MMINYLNILKINKQKIPSNQQKIHDIEVKFFTKPRKIMISGNFSLIAPLIHITFSKFLTRNLLILN